MAHRIIAADYRLIRLDVEFPADAPDWAPRLWFATLELPDSLPRTYPRPTRPANL